jgi:hypothetical protein
MPEYEPVASPDATTVFPYHDLTPPATADVYRAREVVERHSRERRWFGANPCPRSSTPTST